MPLKVALVTGSSAGLGASIAKSLSRDYRVVINYNSSQTKAEEVAAACSATEDQNRHGSSSRNHIIKADVSDRSAVKELVDEVVSVMGRLDVVVSNVGWTRMVNFSDLEQNVDEGDWDRCFSTNVKSHLWLFHAAKPHLEANATGGSFLIVGSIAGVVPSGSSMAYSVAKAAAIHLSKCLASTCGPQIRCNSLSPGLMLTDWGHQFPAKAIENLKAKSALNNIAEVEDVAELARTLVQNHSLTGQNFVIDCGITFKTG